MKFRCDGTTINWEPNRLIIAGYTGRDQEMVKKHIDELKDLGVPAPPKVPMLYALSSELLSVTDTISVVRNDSSGEAEVVLLDIEGQWYVGLGSDHTDRVLESISVQKSKQLCAKVVSEELWTFESVKEHWNELELRSWIDVDGEEVLYQNGTLSEFLHPMELLEIIKDRGYYDSGMALFCGTLPLETESFHLGGVFKAELHDKTLNRKLTIRYETEILKDAELE